MRNRRTLLLALLSFPLAFYYSAADTVPYSIEDFMHITAYHPVSIADDNSSLLLSSSADGQINAYEVPLEGGPIRQLTFSKHSSISPISYLPGQKGFLYQSDKAGDEISHIFLQDSDGRQKDLTPYPGIKALFVQWRPDKESFLLLMNLREKSAMDLYEMDLASLTLKELFINDQNAIFSDLSPDGKLVCLGKVENSHNSNLYLYDLDTKKLEAITPHEGNVLFEGGTFTQDNKSLLYTSDENSDFNYLVKMDLSSKEKEVIVSKGWDIVTFGQSEKGNYLLVSTNEDSQYKLHLFTYPELKEVEIPFQDGALIGHATISSDEKYLAYGIETTSSPDQAFVVEIGTSEPKQLTFLKSAVPKERFVEGSLVRFSSFDGTEIPAILFTPKKPTGGALLWAHGGPGGQSMMGWNPQFQYLLNEGYTIMAVNNRGSAGYGKAFYAAADKKHGDWDLLDYIFAKNYLKTLPHIDRERIGIMGGSYGGYLVLAALAFHDVFACGIDIYGVSNWVRTLSDYPPWWESQIVTLHEKIGHPETDLEYLESISPLFHAEKIKKPLLVIQGANDPRVVKAESDEIVDKVRANQIPCEYILFEDEGHGIVKRENRIHAWGSIKNFLKTYL